MRSSAALLLPVADLAGLRERVRRLAEDRPGTYRMVEESGRVLYVGKAKQLRTRLLSYFRARYPEEKGARILHASSDIAWDVTPSEFAAHLAELRQIRQYRPPYNVQMNRRRAVAFAMVGGGAAPRISAGPGSDRPEVRSYGPIASPGRLREALRVLNDLLGLRDCAEKMPIHYAGQGDLFEAPRAAGCLRYDLGTCAGPCAGKVSEEEYLQRVEAGVAFLEGRAIHPIDRVVTAMTAQAEQGEFEAAARWREKFEHLEWLLAATTRARAAVELLTFVYRDPGSHGDDRAYLIRRGTVRAVYPWPGSPIEKEAFAAVVREELSRAEPAAGPLPAATLEETLLLMAWFRKHPEALRRTSTLESWV
jgi:excinuclease ABC subunit C